MKTNYRQIASEHLSEAKSTLTKKGPAEARSAALSLRMCMEALTYERANVYKDDLPQGQYETWQPRKLMMQMLEIDPYADREATISIGREPSLGETPKKMHELGTEKPMKLAALKKHYDAIGAYLHIPTIKQTADGKLRDEDSLRKRCAIIIAELDWCMSATVWNSSLKRSARLKCNCGEAMTRRFKDGDEPRVVTCHNCSSRYTLTSLGIG